MNFDKSSISRTSYAMLNFIGDVGGLDGALLIMGSILAEIFCTFKARSFSGLIAFLA